MSNGKTFQLADVDFLTSTRGQQLMQELTHQTLSDHELLQLVPKLRKTYSADETSAAIEISRLRRQAVGKFGDDAEKMLFTQDALEQASDPLVRQFRAADWLGQTADMCSSIGTDALSFAQAGWPTIGFDIDPVRVAMACWNAEVLDANCTFTVADVHDLTNVDATALYYDPARRDVHGRRLHDVEHYQPPLSLIKQWRPHYAHLAIKLSPAVNLSQLADYGGQIRFIAVENDLKESELRLSAHDEHEPQQTEAVLLCPNQPPLRYPCTIHESPVKPEADPQQWLFEPNPAILRAGYVAHLAHDINASFLDESIAYLTTYDEPQTDWGRAWKIQDWMPFNLKKLRAYLKARNIGRITVKKRGSPITPETLTTKLKLKGENSCTLILTQRQGSPIVIIATDYVA